jgi:uncharacterized membrane protein YecN with MAPEG domain
LDYVNLVVFLALVEYAVFGVVAGSRRGKYGVAPPATTGNLEWERLNRIHGNTLEQLIVFIPAIYGFAHYVSESWAAGIGAIFLVGRIAYFFGYRAAAEKRALGAILSAPPSYVLLIGAIVGLVRTLL